jgi:hypothetical protein
MSVIYPFPQVQSSVWKKMPKCGAWNFGSASRLINTLDIGAANIPMPMNITDYAGYAKEMFFWALNHLDLIFRIQHQKNIL